MKIPILTGATASGKNALMYSVIQDHDIEIISADAYQVYRYMNVGTSKPSREELASVPHHFIDIIDPSESYSAGLFFDMAERRIEEILSRGKIPVVLGGTALYINTLINGMFECPSSDPGIRAMLKDRLSKEGVSPLYKELLTVDKDYTDRITHNDSAKIMRALEVFYLTKIPFSKAHEEFRRMPKYSYYTIVLDENRGTLYDNINDRVVKMFCEGWVDEVEYLLYKGYGDEFPSFKGIGYTEICSLIRGEVSLEDVVSRVQKRTRNFAKRQQTWFRNSGWSDLFLSPCDVRSHVKKVLSEFRM